MRPGWVLRQKHARTCTARESLPQYGRTDRGNTALTVFTAALPRAVQTEDSGTRAWTPSVCVFRCRTSVGYAPTAAGGANPPPAFSWKLQDAGAEAAAFAGVRRAQHQLDRNSSRHQETGPEFIIPYPPRAAFNTWAESTTDVVQLTIRQDQYSSRCSSHGTLFAAFAVSNRFVRFSLSDEARRASEVGWRQPDEVEERRGVVCGDRRARDDGRHRRGTGIQGPHQRHRHRQHRRGVAGRDRDREQPGADSAAGAGHRHGRLVPLPRAAAGRLRDRLRSHRLPARRSARTCAS